MWPVLLNLWCAHESSGGLVRGKIWINYVWVWVWPVILYLSQAPKEWQYCLCSDLAWVLRPRFKWHSSAYSQMTSFPTEIFNFPHKLISFIFLWLSKDTQMSFPLDSAYFSKLCVIVVIKLKKILKIIIILTHLKWKILFCVKYIESFLCQTF